MSHASFSPPSSPLRDDNPLAVVVADLPAHVQASKIYKEYAGEAFMRELRVFLAPDTERSKREACRKTLLELRGPGARHYSSVAPALSFVDPAPRVARVGRRRNRPRPRGHPGPVFLPASFFHSNSGSRRRARRHKGLSDDPEAGVMECRRYLYHRARFRPCFFLLFASTRDAAARAGSTSTSAPSSSRARAAWTPGGTGVVGAGITSPATSTRTPRNAAHRSRRGHRSPPR